MDIPMPTEMAVDENQRSRSPSYKLASPRWDIARARTWQLHAEKLRDRLERISPPRWKSRDELYAMAIREPYHKSGMRTSSITPTPPSILSPSPGPSLYQPSLWTRASSLSPRTTQSPSPPTTRSLSLDDNTSMTSFEDDITGLPKFASPQYLATPSSESATPPPKHSHPASRYRKPAYRGIGPKPHHGIIQTLSKYRIEKPSNHSMITRSRLRNAAP